MLRNLFGLLVWGCAAYAGAEEPEWPAFPEKNATLEIPAQEWPQQPGPRSVRVKVFFPGGDRAKVSTDTGVMLSLHNWGGEDCVGTADPQTLANELNVVALCVNYLQSGKRDSVEAPEPYDFGYLQALDALRALWFTVHGLDQAKVPFARGRIFATGGSGGGNVTLMCNKLAPRTFACIVDMCGMKKLSHDIAFNLPGGSSLNARYSRDPQSKNFLSVDEQELRFVGHPQHLSVTKSLGNNTKMVIVHGEQDATCPFADAQELVANLQAAEFAVEPRFIGKAQLDGTVFTSAGHPLGNRTKIATKMVKEYFPHTAEVPSRKTDFDWADAKVRYPTTNGDFVISYERGYPVGRFELRPAPPDYPDQHELLTYRSDVGKAHPVQTRDDWARRRDHIRAHLERVMGPLPSAVDRMALGVETLSEEHLGSVTYRKIRYQSDGFDKVTAWLLIPDAAKEKKRPAMLCLHQTTNLGKDEPVGRGGLPSMHYAKELAERGYVTLSPDYPSFGEHPYDFAANPQYASGSMKAAWDNIRAVDLLSSLEEVDAERIGVIGHSLGGHNAIFTAVFEPR
ncbi:MAG TPA: DUF2920 family protein, partial [Planctomycetaceae bacterium]|nr:DUF2920 family protein [Planctomycetaceae bacterium]